MTSRNSAEVAVLASTPVPWILGGSADAMISLGLGLLGVLLARTIFINRENRALGRRQPIRETLPITLAACLIAGGIIWDGHLLYSKAIFTGIGVGWTTIVIIDAISKLVNPGGPPPPPTAPSGSNQPTLPTMLRGEYPVQADLPPDQSSMLDQLGKEPPVS